MKTSDHGVRFIQRFEGLRLEAYRCSAGVPFLLLVLHWIAGLVVLAEALNKLERLHFRWRGINGWSRAALLLKLLAWAVLAIGSAVAIAGPLVNAPRPQLDDVLVLGGFAILIIRTRIKDEIAT